MKCNMNHEHQFLDSCHIWNPGQCVKTTNPNLPTEVVGKVQNRLFPRGKEGRVEKEKSHAACPAGAGLEPGTYRMLDQSPQLHATDVV